MSLIQKILKNSILKYTIKGIQRSFFLKKMEKMNIEELMKYDADLYAKRHGELLNWDNLQTYSEKMQWEKLFDHDERKVVCADKYRVREWVKEKIGEEYLIPLLGVWDRAEDIDFDKLPNQFVLKTNCSSGDVIIVRDKSKLTSNDIKGYRKKLDYYLDMKFGFNTCELHYNDMIPKIVAEAFISSPGNDLPDYKFLCFDGKPYFCWVDIDRYHGHKRNVYDMNWNLQDWHQYSYEISKEGVDKPDNFDKMAEIATILSKGFSHVRVDLYDVNGKIYFGEMTFTNSSGFEKIEPKSADYMLGDLWKVDTKCKND